MSVHSKPAPLGTHVPTDNSVYQGYRLEFPSNLPAVCEHHTVYRPKHTIFDYCAWPSACSDENGTIYAVSAAFRTSHTCPFGKLAMYISKDGGKTWSCPIVVVDSYCEDNIAGLCYLGNGRIALSWCSKPADINYNEVYNRLRGTIWGGHGSLQGDLRCAMVDCYPELPLEYLVGGSFIKVSEDYGLTWSEPVRLPVQNVLGATRCKDGTVLFLGKEYFASTERTFERFRSGVPENRITADTWDEWAAKLYQSRWGDEVSNRPIYAYVSTDGGYTWEKRGECDKPEGLQWFNTSEPYALEQADGTLVGVMRVENEVGYENDFTVYLNRSTDGGYTWSPWECTHIAGSPPHLMEHSSGKLILTVSRRVRNPMGQFALISEDGGRTWTKEYAINAQGVNYDLGQPATVELPDGSLATIYYQRYVDPETGVVDEKPCIMCTKWTL